MALKNQLTLTRKQQEEQRNAIEAKSKRHQKICIVTYSALILSALGFLAYTLNSPKPNAETKYLLNSIEQKTKDIYFLKDRLNEQEKTLDLMNDYVSERIKMDNSQNRTQNAKLEEFMETIKKTADNNKEQKETINYLIRDLEQKIIGEQNTPTYKKYEQTKEKENKNSLTYFATLFSACTLWFAYSMTRSSIYKRRKRKIEQATIIE